MAKCLKDVVNKKGSDKAKDFQGVLDAVQDANEREQEFTSSGFFRTFYKQIFDDKATIRRAFRAVGKQIEDLAPRVLRKLDLTAGGSANGGVVYQEAARDSFSDLKKGEFELVGNIALADRIITLDTHKVEVAQKQVDNSGVGIVFDMREDKDVTALGVVLNDPQLAKSIQAQTKKKLTDKGAINNKFNKHFITLSIKINKKTGAFDPIPHYIQTKPGAEKYAEKQIDKVLGESKISHPGGMTREHAQEWLDVLAKEEPTLFKSARKRVAIMHKKFEEQLGVALDAGIISQSDYDHMEKVGDYHPRRYLKFLDPDQTFNSFDSISKGSTQALLTDPALLMHDYMVRLHDRIARNDASQELHSVIMKNPNSKHLDKVVKLVGDTGIEGGWSAVPVYVDGEKITLQMPKDLAEEWNGRDPAIAHATGKMIGYLFMAPILRATATGLNPGFAVTNFPRDIFFSWFRTDEYSRQSPIALFQIAKQLWKVKGDVWTTDDVPKGKVKDYFSEKGGMEFMTAQGLVLEKHTKGGASFLITHPKLRSLEKVLSFMGQKTELWTRIALRERALDNRMKLIKAKKLKGNELAEAIADAREESTWIARNYLDFAQGGQTTKVIDRFVPYFNAGMVATKGMIETMQTNPALATHKMAQFGILFTAITLNNLIRHPDEWKNTPENDRHGKWLYYLPLPPVIDEKGNEQYPYLSIQMDQGQQAFSNLFFATLIHTLRSITDATGYDFGIHKEILNVRLDPFFDSAQKLIPFSAKMPPVAHAWIGSSANWHHFYKKPIWQGRDVNPGDEFEPDTHELFIAIAHSLNWLTPGEPFSPVRIRYALQQIITPANSVVKMVDAGSDVWDYFDSKEKKELADLQWKSILAASPLANRAFKLTKKYNVEDIENNFIIKREANSKQQKVRIDIETLLDEYNDMEQGKNKEFTAEERDVLGKIGSRINESNLGEDEKEKFRRQAKNAMGYKRKHGKGYPNAYFWRTVMDAKEDSTRAEQMYSALSSKTPEKRKQLLETFHQLRYLSTTGVKRHLAKMIRDNPFEE